MKVLFVHGALVSDGPWWWHRMVEPLARHGLATGTIVLPSCEAAPGELGDMYADAAAVSQSVAAAGEPVILCGHSYGGTVGLSSMQLHHVRRGSGKPLLLVPGLGATWQSWDTILDALAREREVIAVNLPGFGATPPLAGEVSIATLTDAVEVFINEQGLAGIDTVGSSMGARMVLELARRRVGGTTVALAPGGFWSRGQQQLAGASLHASITLLRALHRLTMPVRCVTGNVCSSALDADADHVRCSAGDLIAGPPRHPGRRPPRIPRW